MCLPWNRERVTAKTTANVLGRHAGLPLQANAERERVQAHKVRLKQQAAHQGGKTILLGLLPF